jgi:propionyl-CoA carboxylase alpha chain
LSIQQEDLQINGHALELRVYAEDPLNDFLPSIGNLIRYKRPMGPNFRLDDGYDEGMDIPIYYDPMIAKLVTYGATREAAIRYMLEAIEKYEIEGLATTLPFGKFVCQHEAFTSGQFDTHFVKDYFTPEAIQAYDQQEGSIAAHLAARLQRDFMRGLQMPKIKDNSWLENRR